MHGCCAPGRYVGRRLRHERRVVVVSIADSTGPAAPISSVDELRADVFDSDAELDGFLGDLYAFRHATMA